jgi:hypothetical protein
MDLQSIQKQLDEVEFPKETADAIRNIVAMAMARDSILTDEEITEILNLIDDDLAKNKKETVELLNLVEAVQDVQDAMTDALDEARALGLDEQDDQSKKSSEQSAPATQPANPQTT